jgi:hypothetical protein
MDPDVALFKVYLIEFVVKQEGISRLPMLQF